MSFRTVPLVAALLLTSFSFADDLAALAKKEKARRAQVSKPAKVYTEEEAKTNTAGAAVTTLPASSTAADPPPAGAPLEDQKAQWKARAAAARQTLLSLQDNLAAMGFEVAEFQSDQAPLTAEELLDPLRLQKREAKVAEMRAQMALQGQQVAEAKKALAALESEARKQGIPPGWLR